MSRFTDITRQPHPTPCQDCGRTHLSGEHVSWKVVDGVDGFREAWSGCVDCWIRRSGPVVDLTALTQARIARIAEIVIGLGAADVEGCNLCHRPIPCPTHVGAEIAHQIVAAATEPGDTQ